MTASTSAAVVEENEETETRQPFIGESSPRPQQSIPIIHQEELLPNEFSLLTFFSIKRIKAFHFTDLGQSEDVMFFQQQLLTQVPTREEIDAEILPTVEKRTVFTPKENQLFKYMLSFGQERRRYSMGIQKNKKIDWKKFSKRWTYVTKVLSIKSRRQGESDTHFYKRSEATLRQKAKDLAKKEKN